MGESWVSFDIGEGFWKFRGQSSRFEWLAWLERVPNLESVHDEKGQTREELFHPRAGFPWLS
jgi:hypothetical protein